MRRALATRRPGEDPAVREEVGALVGNPLEEDPPVFVDEGSVKLTGKLAPVLGQQGCIHPGDGALARLEPLAVDLEADPLLRVSEPVEDHRIGLRGEDAAGMRGAGEGGPERLARSGFFGGPVRGMVEVIRDLKGELTAGRDGAGQPGEIDRPRGRLLHAGERRGGP